MSAGMKQIIEFAKTEGKAQGFCQGFEEGRRIRDKEISLRLAEKGHSADEIAELIGLDLRTVRRFLAD